MKCAVKITGSAVLVNSAPCRLALADLKEWLATAGGGAAAVQIADQGETLAVTVAVTAVLSRSRAGEVDRRLAQLGEFAVTGYRVSSEWDGEPGWFWIGPNKRQIEEAASRWALQEMLRHVDLLLPPDRAILQARLSP